MELFENQTTASSFQYDWPSRTKNFKKKDDLQSHRRNGTNKTSFICHECGKGLKNRRSLRLHRRKHTGEKPYQCPYKNCGQRFTFNSPFNRHLLKHTGKRPYKCAHSGCSRNFYRKDNLDKHQRTWHPQGMVPKFVDEDSLASANDESPSTFQHPSMTWPPDDMTSLGQEGSSWTLHPAPLYFGTESQVRGPYVAPHHVQQHENSTTIPLEYHTCKLPEQHTDIRHSHPATTIPRQAYHVTDQWNSGIATMASPLPAYDYLPQQMERLGLEMPPSAPGFPASAQSSPSIFSTTSVPSLMNQDDLYRHQQATHLPCVTVETQSDLVQYHQLVHHYMAQPEQPIVSQPQHTPAISEDYCGLLLYPQQEQWALYDVPIEAVTFEQLLVEWTVSCSDWTTILKNNQSWHF